MNKRIKKKWVKALRSGEFRQGYYSLYECRNTDSGEEVHQFCCLGVLAHIAVPQPWKPSSPGSGVFGFRDPKTKRLYVNKLPNSVLDQLKLERHIQNELIYLNDLENWSFRKIAHWIDKHL